MRDASIADNEMCGIYMTPNPDYPNMDHDEVILWNQLRAMEGNIGPTGDLSINENGIEWYINDPYVGFAYLIWFDHIQL